MRKLAPSEMSTSSLVSLFSSIGIAQDAALLGGQYAKFNRLFDQMSEVAMELKRRDGDQRRALIALYTFPNMQVRLKAAVHTLAVVPLEARNELKAIADSKWFPQAGDAGMTLRGLEQGGFKPV